MPGSSSCQLAAARAAARVSFTLSIVVALGLGGPTAAQANKAFDSPQAAMEAFGKAVADANEAALKDMLGPQFRDLIPPVGAEDRERFLQAWARSHAVQGDNGKLATLAVGDDGWTLPIPLVKSASGWQFDTVEGVEEMRVRRIGRNELAAQQTLLAIADAQLDYVSQARDDDGLLAYAQKLKSTPGRRDGLFWPTKPGQTPSPIGPALAAAAVPNATADGYYGYQYKLLTKQGPHASGGPLDYLVNGKLIGGYGIIAWPARYWDTGVMTFIMNHEGQVYERDLGPDSAKKAAATTSFDPGPGWQKATP